MNWIIVCVFQPSNHLCYIANCARSLDISLAALTECAFVHSVIKKPNFKSILIGAVILPISGTSPAPYREFRFMVLGSHNNKGIHTLPSPQLHHSPTYRRLLGQTDDFS